MRIVFQAQNVCRREKGSSLRLNCQLSRKRNVHIYITILCQVKCWKYCCQVRDKIAISSWYCDSPQTLQLYLGQTKLVWQHLDLPIFFPICNIFPILSNAYFFTSGIGPDILMKVFEDYIISLIWAAWVLFNFISKTKVSSLELLLKIPPSFPSMKEFGQWQKHS